MMEKITVSRREDTFHKDEPSFRHSAWVRECVLTNQLVIKHAVVKAPCDFPFEDASPLLDDWEQEMLTKVNSAYA